MIYKNLHWRCMIALCTSAWFELCHAYTPSYSDR